MTASAAHRFARRWFFVALLGLLARPLPASEPPAAPADSANRRDAEIRVVDDATGRGVPLVELETVNGLVFVTDNAGRVAFHEPGLMDRQIFLSVRSHGYEIPKDGFGFRGVRVTPRVAEPVEIAITRRNAAQRLCRLTGEGLYRDSLLLGYESPRNESPNPGRVAGQDSVQAAIYRDKVHYFWGDTQRMEYPLGLFRVAGATTPIPEPAHRGSDPAPGIAYDYFTDKHSGFARAMMPLAERPEGVVWVSAVFTVPDERGQQRLVGHYTRRPGLQSELEQGIALFDDDKAEFQSVRQLPLAETWRRPSGHPIKYQAEGVEWLLFGSPHPNVRVPATLRDVLDPDKYQAYSCAGGGADAAADRPRLGADGRPVWRWQTELPPTTTGSEYAWVKAGLLEAAHARYYPAAAPAAAAPAERIALHSGSVRWNPYRQRWLLVAVQIGGSSSHLGEVWYSEALSPTGPFHQAVRIVTHDRQSFYNVCHHAFLDRDDGRTIHFEGTYTNDFSGNPARTPRYNYNQVLYRLDLDHAALAAARVDASGRDGIDGGADSDAP